MYKALQVAEAILAYCYEQEHSCSNRKLQMLLYYVQGWHLATADEPLFDEVIHAGPIGPVIHTVERRYKGHGNRPIHVYIIDAAYHEKLRPIVSEVWSAYGDMTDFDLQKLIQEEIPYLAARQDLIPTDPALPAISIDELWVFFQDQLSAREAYSRN
ncbi:DUF4065 domain-containing protein [Telmatocola sphagniphila]|uniref:DUF4065 domain-containing protein n=1 Tax=Telmatocola sphagniphila TaxID=1123043 RepID=A0A8E6B6H7_9BACT|nr:type II toxin-antitoxin system antitoxin SocA domain-containing protein [Telmatocola sphagniphila]QVL32061.1 DUF4065 domain-containing protein [Telmatocola sphagniphila]